MQRHLTIPRDPVSAYTHLAGMLFSVAGTVIICFNGHELIGNADSRFISAIVFGISLIALYGASTIYHWYNGSGKSIQVLRKLDHSMIYVLIAGTYTPILTAYLPTHKAMMFITFMWAAAAVGITMKLCLKKISRLFSTLLYVLMGWAILFDITAIKSMESGAFGFLLAGGVAYTVGGVIYAIKKPNISKSFGFHEIFHVFVMLGSLLHYLVVILYVL